MKLFSLRTDLRCRLTPDWPRERPGRRSVAVPQDCLAVARGRASLLANIQRIARPRATMHEINRWAVKEMPAPDYIPLDRESLWWRLDGESRYRVIWIGEVHEVPYWLTKAERKRRRDLRAGRPPGGDSGREPECS